ncbi:DUF202 domain-containing protein [Streptomyces sp. TRM43335]|uniref:DUF202 domain-containing protein n=1 Tax=Streptomyces taklimakanensis TaxID=2569853 RepID=A0A6G2B7V2_9ACTN|nr:DUF202 domain-containing protein [Streptomyces taklimakanensis]
MDGGAAGGGPPGGVAAVRDPAAQPERTRLAWRRTVLAFAVVTVLAVRHAAHGSGASAWWAAVAAAAAWVGLVAVAARRVRALTDPRPTPLGVSGALFAVICTLAVPISGVVVLLW